MFGLFFKKKEIEEVKEETKKGFDNVKKDLSSIGEWIKHLDSEKKNHKKEINELKTILSTIKEELEELKNTLLIKENHEYEQQYFDYPTKFKTPIQTKTAVLNKQTPVYSIQTDVQTNVQTPNINQFSITERAILWILLNTDMKLSYDDLAAMLGKEKSTIRGQINTIKQKSEILEEIIEKNGKKRVSIPDEIKEKMLKKAKVRVNNRKKTEKY
ncbi:MAG: hypothetical protein OQK82_08315 [Candidatus Pacearchaeota archaeon]|nr:hypothetical protein [Candidatus Pacearchaeota archaeon]